MQTQKSTYAANFQVVEAEQQANLAKQKHLNKRIVDLIVELGWLNMLNPKITLPNSKLKGNLDLCVHLSALENSFHPNIIHLLYQHEGQEKDLSTTVNAHNISIEYQIDVLCWDYSIWKL